MYGKRKLRIKEHSCKTMCSGTSKPSFWPCDHLPHYHPSLTQCKHAKLAPTGIEPGTFYRLVHNDLGLLHDNKLPKTTSERGRNPHLAPRLSSLPSTLSPPCSLPCCCLPALSLSIAHTDAQTHSEQGRLRECARACASERVPQHRVMCEII